MIRVAAVVGVLMAAITASATPSAARPVSGAAACEIFPADNPWNRRVDTLPVAAGSARLVAAMGFDNLHPDFSDSDADGYGIPYTVTSSSTPTANATFEYDDESDPGPYPFPANPAIENGGDLHVLMVDKDACRLYELYHAEKNGDAWTGGSGAIWDLNSNALRPDGWTSADAAGLPILPGLVRYEDIAGGGIDHALRVTVPVSQHAYLWPARHYASDDTHPSATPMGLRVRLKASFDISGFPPQTQAVLLALRQYGMIVADNGTGGYVSGAPDPAWDDDDLHSMHDVPASAFEVVDTSTLPHTPSAVRIWNTRWTRSSGGRTRIARAYVTKACTVRAEAVVRGHVRRRHTVHVRQGYVQVSVRSARGARYRLRVV